MVSLTRSDAVLELGKRLVTQLDAGNDLLTAWMAHYVAEQIEAVEASSSEERAAAAEACTKTILDLWAHQNALPAHLRPFQELEPVLRSLVSLDVDRSTHRYYPQALREAATADTNEEAKLWLDFAIGLDYSARLLIRFALRRAADRAASDAAAWIELARQAGADDLAETAVVAFVQGGMTPEESSVSEAGEALMDKVDRLDGFVTLATELGKVLRAELEAQGRGLEETDGAGDSSEHQRQPE